jgi:hypothetical protein
MFPLREVIIFIKKWNKAVNPCHFWIERGIISPVTGLVMRVSIANSLKGYCWPLIKNRQTFLLTPAGVKGECYDPKHY